MSVITSTFVVPNAHGLHARPAALLAATAARYVSRISVKNGGGFVDGKSVIELLVIGAAKGTRLTVVAEGPDAGVAMNHIKCLFDESFGES